MTQQFPVGEFPTPREVEDAKAEDAIARFRPAYEEVIAVATDLCGETLTEGMANEYVRGQCELIGDLFGRFHVELGDRKVEVLNDMLRCARGEQDPMRAIERLEDALRDADPDLVEAVRVVREALTNKED